MVIGKRCTLFIFVFFVLLLFSFGIFGVYHAENIATNSNKNETTIKKIIIDAGHGGIDGGAVSNDGTSEKNINLDISLKLNEMLKSFGFSTILTRDSDISVHSPDAKTIRQKKVSDIHNRFKIIEDNTDALFISIHQNKFGLSSLNGAQIFYSPNNAESPILANAIQNSFSLIQPDNTRQIKKCGTEVYLIYHAPSPAVLVECGFLSNYKECEKLKTEEYRKEVAFTIFCGILDYYSENEKQNRG